jgi:multidrug efflux pump subunit AcrB
MGRSQQVVRSAGFRLLAAIAVVIGCSRPAFPADLLELLGLSSAGSAIKVVVVEATYPGANARTMADVVAAPIEQQVNGVEKMRHMRSRCTNRGTYALQIVFDKNADMDLAQVLVQNRVSLALPLLPATVQDQGITVRKRSPSPFAIFILRSPDGSHDICALDREATINVRDELVRVPGICGIRTLGESACPTRIVLKPKELAAHKLAVGDVLTAIQEQHAAPAKGQSEQTPGVFDARVVGRLDDPEQLLRIILKTDTGGKTVTLKDVAQVDAGPDLARVATLGGKPVVAFAVYGLPGATPQTVIADLKARLREIRSRLPKGMAIDAGFDFAIGAANKTAGKEYLLIGLDFPGNESRENRQENILHCQAVVGKLSGVQDVLALPESPFVILDGPSCLVVRLKLDERDSTAIAKTADAIRVRLSEVKGTRSRLHRLPKLENPTGAGYPIDMAVCGDEAGNLKKLTLRLASRLRESKKLTDVWCDSEREPSPQLCGDVDRAGALRHGVTPSAVADVLAALGETRSGDTNSIGRSWQLKIALDEKPEPDLAKLMVRSRSGNLVPLSLVATLRAATAPAIVDRFNLRPMVEVSANPAASVSLADARATCETLFNRTRKELGLNEGIQLNWLSQ